MTIRLPEELEASILAQVHRGVFTSLDDAMSEAARLLLGRLERDRQPASRTTGRITPSLGAGRGHAEAAGATAAAGIGSQDQVIPDEGEPVGPVRKRIWERAAELRRAIPAEEWDKLSVDGARQLDHYLYGSPKRPAS